MPLNPLAQAILDGYNSLPPPEDIGVEAAEVTFVQQHFIGFHNGQYDTFFIGNLYGAPIDLATMQNAFADQLTGAAGRLLASGIEVGKISGRWPGDSPASRAR